MDPEVRQQLDRAHQARVNGQYGDAEPLYRQALEQVSDPREEAEVLHGLGLTLVLTGEFEAGLEELARAHDKAPDHAGIFLELAKTHLMLGMYEQAQPELREIAEQFPDTREADEAKKQLSYFE